LLALLICLQPETEGQLFEGTSSRKILSVVSGKSTVRILPLFLHPLLAV
jgi:hypothetical protein